MNTPVITVTGNVVTLDGTDTLLPMRGERPAIIHPEAK